MQEEHPLLEPREQPIDPSPVEAGARGAGRPLEPIEDARLVAGGLESPEEPSASVGEGLVVEIDRILRGEHDPQAEGAGLLEERQQRRLAGGIGRRREIAEHLVHDEQRLEARCSRLGAHPRHRLTGQERDKRHPLGVVQVRDRDHAHARLPGRRPEEPADIERLSVKPSVEARRRGDGVEFAGELEAVGGREEVFQLEKADPLDRRGGNSAHKRAEVDLLATLPEGVDDRRHEEMLAAPPRLGVDAGHGENTGNERLDPLAPSFGIVEDRLGGRLQAGEHRQRPAGRAARGVDRHVDALAEPGDPLP